MSQIENWGTRIQGLTAAEYWTVTADLIDGTKEVEVY